MLEGSAWACDLPGVVPFGRDFFFACPPTRTGVLSLNFQALRPTPHHPRSIVYHLLASQIPLHQPTHESSVDLISTQDRHPLGRDLLDLTVVEDDHFGCRVMPSVRRIPSFPPLAELSR